MQKEKILQLQYWCHICQKKFVLQVNNKNNQNQLVECPYCKQMATQLIEAANHPQQFKAYQPVTNSNPPTNQQEERNIQQVHEIQRNLLGMFNTLLPPQFNNQNLTQQQRGRNLLMRGLHSTVSQAMNLAFQNIIANPQARGFVANIGRIFRQNAVNFFAGMNNESNIAATALQISKLKTVQTVHQCSICQNIEADLTNSQCQSINKGYELDCGHKFHQLCIKPWFQRANTCPTCRRKLK